MKAIEQISTAILLAFLASACSKYYGCDEELDCKSQKPSRGTLQIRITPPSPSDTVWIEVRKGTWSEGRVVHSGPLTEKRAEFRFSLQERYTAEALYSGQGDSLRAYDSGRLDLEDTKNCGDLCYKVDGLELDLRKGD